MTNEQKVSVSNLVLTINNVVVDELKLDVRWYTNPCRRRGVFCQNWASVKTPTGLELICSDVASDLIKFLNGYLVAGSFGFVGRNSK